MSLTGAITQLQAHALSLSGVKDAPTYPPESIDIFPFAVAYLAEGNWSRMTDFKKGIHTIFVEFHCNRGILPTAIQQATGFVDSFPNKILNEPTLCGEVDTILMDAGQPVKYQFGKLDWGNEEHVGVRFIIQFKINSPFT